MKKVKLLVACLIAVSFAACGSSGGGGHDGGSNTTKVDKFRGKSESELEKIKVETYSKIDGGDTSFTSKQNAKDGEIAVNDNPNAWQYDEKNMTFMDATGDSMIINRKSGKIEVDGPTSANSCAMQSKSGGIAINDGGIVIDDINGQGINTLDEGSLAINNGDISVGASRFSDVPNYEIDGILAINGAKGINKGTIFVRSNEGDSVATKKIDDNNIASAGMAAYRGATIENRDIGKINVDSRNLNNNLDDYSYAGMAAVNKGSNAINYGRIDVSNRGIGMVALDGGSATNHGDIYLNRTESYGMVAMGQGSVIDNQGTIHMSGSKENENEDSNHNIAMKAVHGGTIINRGKITFGN